MLFNIEFDVTVFDVPVFDVTLLYHKRGKVEKEELLSMERQSK